MTTIERKRMSTKTTIKRIALVAAASLGLGVLSVVPAQAAPSAPSITVVNGTKTAGSGALETTTGATISISSLTTATTDSIFVTLTPKSVSPASHVGVLQYNDTVVSGVTSVSTDTVQVISSSTGAVRNNKSLRTGGTDSITAVNGNGSAAGFVISGGSNTGYISGSFRLYMDTYISNTLIAAGTYTWTITAIPYTAGTAGTAVTTDVSIVASSPTISGSTSTSYLGTTSAPTSDAVSPTGVSTTSNSTPVGYISVTLKDANGAAVTSDTVTVTTTIGNVGTSTAVGKNVQFAYSGTALNIGLFPDGTSGTATISVSTLSGVTFPSKTFTFYSTTISTLTVTPVSTTLAVGSNSSALVVVAKDATGNWVASAAGLYIFSDATSVVSETATAGCTAVTASQYAVCTLTGVAAGTANVMVGSSVTKTVVTSAVKVTVTSNPIASIAITSNKSSYAPGEKAYIRVTAKDAAGNSVAPQTISSFLASGGISTDIGLGAGSDTLTSVNATLSAQTTTGYSTGDAVLQYTVYMPAGASSVTFSATGGTGLPSAAQKAATLTVSVTDSGSQALAAVTALASQVSAFITKINAQITTLTVLVMKIQKKVKA